MKGDNSMSDYPAMTIATLAAVCAEQIKKGNGDKKILISCDDEGNGFHGLFYSFNDSKEDIEACEAAGLFHDNVNPDEVVLLG
jgi:hypothetical protein